MPESPLPGNGEPLGAPWAREVRTRLASLDLAPEREAEIVEELSQHLQDRWQELVAAGLAPDDASRTALDEFRGGDGLARRLAPLHQAHSPRSIPPGAPYGVARRTGEIAIRIALGAQSSRVIAMILRETAGVLVVGLALGGGMAYWAARLIESRLYGIAPKDPVTLGLSIALLLAVALSAAFLPARRASRTDPTAALRQG